MANRRTHSPAFKAKVALDALRENETLANLSQKHKLHQNVVMAWKKQLCEGASGVFDTRRRGRPRSDDPSTDDLYREIGRLKMELEWLKKKSEAFN